MVSSVERRVRGAVHAATGIRGDYLQSMPGCVFLAFWAKSALAKLYDADHTSLSEKGIACS